MRRARYALLVPVLALALSGCLSQPEEANDNAPQEQPTRPPDVERTPEVVESPPLTVDQPAGPTSTPSSR